MGTETIWLQRPSADIPWGFRLQGGRDLHQPLTVQRVSTGSIASTGLSVGDEVLSIGDIDTTYLTHAQAQQIVKTSGNLLQLHISKRSQFSPGYSEPPQWSTKLDEQLASMNMNDGPYSGGSGGPYSPSGGHGFGPQFPTTPSSPYNRQTSYGSSYSNSSAPPGAPDIHSPLSGPASPGSYSDSQKSQSQTAMPDAVLNMAAKGPPEKKPWSYAPDMSTLKEQREKVRRKTPTSSLPKYQNILNLPSFDDTPPHVVPKKGSSVPSTPSASDVVGDPLASVPAEGGFVKHAQFNSPLQLYSDENAAEALDAQSGGMVAAFKRQTSSGKGQDITQSATYKMIHGLDEPAKPKYHPVYGEGKAPKPVRQPSYDDEVKFSGVNRPSDIPSKSFRHLQNMTVRGAQGEVDNSPIRSNISRDDPDEIGGYDEASIRYLGRKIPSKSFQLLQSMTGGPAPDDATPKRGGPRRTPQRSTPQRSTPQRSTPQREPKQNPDDGVDISYVGANIPSKSFQFLQHSISQPAQTPSTGIESDEGIGPESSTPSTPRSGSSDKHLAPSSIPPPGAPGVTPAQAQAVQARRRRRRPQRSASADALDEPDNVPKDWDENAYLDGRVPLISERDYTPVPPSPGRGRELVVPRTDEFDQKSPFEDKDFDEDAFLSGKIPIFNEAPQERPAKDKDFKWKPEWLGKQKERRRKISHKAHQLGLDEHEVIYSLEKKDNHPDREADRPELTVPFDEQEFLQGKIPVWGGEARPRDPVVKEEVKPIWQESAERKQQAFTEQDLDPLNQRKVHETECEWRETAEKKKQNLTDDKLQTIAQPKDKRETIPQWAEAAAKKQEVVKDQLDVLGKNKDARESTPEWAEAAERKKKVVKRRLPKLEKHKDDQPEKEGDRPELTVPFDEQEFLQGKIPVLGGEAKPREPIVKEVEKPIWKDSADKKKKAFTAAYLDAMENPQEDQTEKEGDRPELPVPFDEEDFLQGKIPVLGGEAKPREPVAKEELKPIWQDSAEKKKQAFTDMYLEAIDKPKEKEEEEPEWADAAKKKKEVVKEQLDNLDKNKEKEEESPEWAAKLAERSGEDIINKVQQQKELSEGGEQIPAWKREFEERQRDEAFGNALLNKIRQSREQTPTQEAEKPEWLIKAEQRKPLSKDQVEAVRAYTTEKRRDADEDEEENKKPFNEEEFLAGNVPLLRGASDPSMRLPPRDPRKKAHKEKAPWQRDTEEAMTDDEFDERTYLKGRLPLARQLSGEIPPKHDFAKIPSRTFNFIRRSVSREPCEGSGYASDSEAGVYGFRRGSTGSFTRSRSHSKERLLDDGKGKEAFNDLVYVGKKIPSKTFLALQKKIDEEPKNSPKAYFEKEMLKRQQSKESKEDEGIDVDDAIEKLDISEHNPKKYLDILKKSVEGDPDSVLKDQVENDVTDF